MKVYRLDVPDRVAMLVGETDTSVDQMRLAGRGVISSWSEVSARIDTTYVDGATKDFGLPWLNSGTLVLRERDSEFARLVEGFGVFLPIHTSRGDFWIFSATTILTGALDPSSDVEYIPGTAKLMTVLQWQFIPDVIANQRVFRVAEIPQFMLFGEEAADAFLTAGWVGPELLEVWRG